jgi:hypothetical protein
VSERHSDDAQLRALLDSIGLKPFDSDELVLDVSEKARGDQMLAEIMATKDDKRGPANLRRRRAIRRDVPLYGAVAAVVALAVVVIPWSGGRPAAADTPALLNFSLVKEDRYPAEGHNAHQVLKALQQEATQQPVPSSLPVQNIELDGWWASSSPPGKSERARTAIIPVHSSSYVLPNADRRTIERHGRPLDQHGRLTSSPNNEARFADTITEIDPIRGPEYPKTLEARPERIDEILAPKTDCATTRGGCLLSAVSELHTHYVISPALSSRLWQILSREPTITTLGTGVDRLGRAVVALTAPSLIPGEQFVVLADPKSGAFRGSERILVKPAKDYGVEPPAVIEFTALVSSRRISAALVPDDSKAVRY